MLVLTRRIQEKVVFPNVGITLEVLRIKGNFVKLGIEAPEQVKILRHEVYCQRQAECPEPAKPATCPEMLMVRDQLTAARGLLQQLQLELNSGKVEQATCSLKRLAEKFTQLECLAGCNVAG